MEIISNSDSATSSPIPELIVIDSPQTLLDFLKTKRCSEFTTKDMTIWLKGDFKLSKIKTTKIIQELKTMGVIERRSVSGNCQSTCASCYEYGCEAEPRPPINFWKVLRWSI